MRTPGFVYVCAATLSLCLIPVEAGVQSAVVEWMEFPCAEATCLVLNAYPASTGESAPAPPPAPEQIVGVVVELPVEDLPPSENLHALLHLLGIEDLTELGRNLARGRLKAAGDPIKTWRDFLEIVQGRPLFRLDEVPVRSTGVSAPLQEAYASLGYPSPEDPLFPHLLHGVLVLYDDDDRLLGGIADLDFGILAKGRSRVASMQVENLGVQPARVYAEGSFVQGDVRDADFVVQPAERVQRRFEFRLGLASMLTGRAGAALRYESAGVDLPLAEFRGERSLSAADMLVAFGSINIPEHRVYWNAYPLYRIALLAIVLGGIVALGLFVHMSPGRFSGDTLLVHSRTLRRRARVVTRRAAHVTAQVTTQTLDRLGHLQTKAFERLRSAATITMPPPRKPRSTIQGPQPPIHDPRSTIHGLRRTIHHPQPLLARTSFLKLQSVVSDRLNRMGADGRAQAAYVATSVRERIAAWMPALPDEQPLTPDSAVRRIEELRDLLTDEADLAEGTHRARIMIRREANTLQHRLGAELQRGRIGPSARSFQIRWGLQLLANALASPKADLETILDTWIRGANRVLESRGPVAVGPTNDEFVSIVRMITS